MFARRITLIFILLTTLSFAEIIKVACIGNSITFGSLLANPITESYPSQLQQILGSGYVVFNYGSPNKVLLGGFPNSYINSSQYHTSILQHYDIIIIILGTNDTQPLYHPPIDNFISDYKALINNYDNFPLQDPPICIIGIPPPIFATWSGYSNIYLTDEIIPRIKSVASQTGNSTADFYNALKDKENLFFDGIHPNIEGAYVMAITAKSAINKVLNPPPEKPKNLSAIGENGYVTLNWDANTEADLAGYTIYRGTIDGGWKDVLVSLDKNMTSYVDTNVNNYITYYYQICAQNTSNNLSARSNQVSATPGGIQDTTPPAVPTNFTATAGSGLVTLNWNANTESDLYQYNLYKGSVQNGWMDYLANLDKNTTSFLDTELVDYTTYYYQISATDNSNNQSARSNQVSATPGGIQDTTPPATPTNFTATTEQGMVNLSWDSNTESDLYQYNLYKGSVQNGWMDYLANLDKNTTSFLDIELVDYTTYYYQISATDNSNNQSARTAQISVTTLSILDNNLLTDIALYQNIPNPFNPFTQISYTIPNDSRINIIIYDLKGNKIKTLLDDYQYSGTHTIFWNGTDKIGQSVSGGIYFYKLQAGDFIQTRKMVLMK